jgi:hypothetical protein
VREFTFDPEDGRLARIIFDAFGIPLVPDTLVSCYALAIEEVRDRHLRSDAPMLLPLRRNELTVQIVGYFGGKASLLRRKP